MSTSPAVEPSDFVCHVRETLQFMILNPDWTKVFKFGGRKYEMSDPGMWQML